MVKKNLLGRVLDEEDGAEKEKQGAIEGSITKEIAIVGVLDLVPIWRYALTAEFLMRPAAFHAIDKPFGEAPWLRLKLALLLTYGSLPRPPELTTIYKCVPQDEQFRLEIVQQLIDLESDEYCCAFLLMLSFGELRLIAPYTAGYFVALMVSVAESLVQSDKPHILSDVLCDASSENELWKKTSILLAVMFHGKSKVAAALITNDDFALSLHDDGSIVEQEHVDTSGRLSSSDFGSLTRPPEADCVFSFKTPRYNSDNWESDGDCVRHDIEPSKGKLSPKRRNSTSIVHRCEAQGFDGDGVSPTGVKTLGALLREKDLACSNHHDAEFNKAVFENRDYMWTLASPIAEQKIGRGRMFAENTELVVFAYSVLEVKLQRMQKAEDEVIRLSKLQITRIKEVILRKKLELEEISRKMHMATQVLKSENFSVEAIESEQIDSEIAKVKEEASSFKRKILEKVEKWMSACEEESSLGSTIGGAHLTLKRAEKARGSQRYHRRVLSTAAKEITKEEDSEERDNGKQVVSTFDGFRRIMESRLREDEQDRKSEFEQQDINLGAEDEPVAISPAIVAQAAAENRFILMGRPVMPRRQNLRSIVASMPRMWGQSGLVHGRIVPGNQFQFIFPIKESLETVMRRGPWAFNDRMLILRRWTPLMNPPQINFIPFWIQIRGIPFQFLSRQVIEEVGQALGDVADVDFDGEAAARIEFVLVQVDWNVENPLRFQRNVQFQAGINTLLRFHYERLRGFCELCGMLTHDSGACLIQNGGGDNNSDGDDDEDLPDAGIQNQGILSDSGACLIQNGGGDNLIIREIADDEENGDPEEIVPEVDVQEEAEENETVEDIDPLHNSLASEMDNNELFNPIPIFENAGDIPGSESYQRYSINIHPREEIMEQSMLYREMMAIERGKRKREDVLDQTEENDTKMVIREKGESSSFSDRSDQCRGAVGPKPPHPP
ncbi:unnamed protein product [Arabidopsis arenosa]|uniref:DUF4283 domain-containing protein n=1 Tax=Arabidopsis arenosa TaxID=38785 RepID=A0A8S1ZHP1_ARAAE|nr:unnamed protein product [Arabidopsis arenosa]